MTWRQRFDKCTKKFNSRGGISFNKIRIEIAPFHPSPPPPSPSVPTFTASHFQLTFTLPRSRILISWCRIVSFRSYFHSSSSSCRLTHPLSHMLALRCLLKLIDWCREIKCDLFKRKIFTFDLFLASVQIKTWRNWFFHQSYRQPNDWHSKCLIRICLL